MEFIKVRNLDLGNRIAFRSNALESYQTGDRSVDLEATITEIWSSYSGDHYILDTVAGRLSPLHRNDDIEFIRNQPTDQPEVKLRHHGATTFRGVSID